MPAAELEVVLGAPVVPAEALVLLAQGRDLVPALVHLPHPQPEGVLGLDEYLGRVVVLQCLGLGRLLVVDRLAFEFVGQGVGLCDRGLQVLDLVAGLEYFVLDYGDLVGYGVDIGINVVVLVLVFYYLVFEKFLCD